MKFTPSLVAAALLLPALALAGAPVVEPAAADKPKVPEPNVQLTVIEDDLNRVEQLNVRGQTRSVVVTTKGPLANTYEIHVGDPSRDPFPGSDSRRAAAGQRVWRVFSF